MVRNRKFSKVKVILGIVLVVLTVGVGFAFLQTDLNINGVTNVKGNSWDIYFDNKEVVAGSVADLSSIDILNKTHVKFSAALTKPGDVYSFTIDVVNNGTVDAMVSLFEKSPIIEEPLSNYISYSVFWVDNLSEPKEFDLLKKKSKLTLKVVVTYLRNDDISLLPTEEETFDMEIGLEYIQADSNAVSVKNPINIVSGDGSNVGDEIAIEDEHFYVVSNDGDVAVLLAKYNLLVGNQNDNGTVFVLSDATGRQDASALAFDGSTSGYLYKGVVRFSDSDYWVDGTGLSSSYGDSFPAWVYDDNASIKQYVDSYKTYLENIGMEILEARLIKYEELTDLGCTMSSWSCDNAPAWVSSTSYWSGNAYQYNTVSFVSVGGTFMYYQYNYDSRFGVRPVIVVPADSLG